MLVKSKCVICRLGFTGHCFTITATTHTFTKMLNLALTLSLPIVPLIDFTLSNARRFYSSMGNPTGLKGLTTARFIQELSPLTLSLPIVPLIDFTLSNARRFYSSMGNPTGLKGLTTARFTQKLSPLTLSLPIVPLIDFTLSNARRFYSSMGNPTGLKGLNITL